MSSPTPEPGNGELIEKHKSIKFASTHGSPKNGNPFTDEEVTSCLETFHERRMRRKSHYVIYVTTFIMSIGFSIILTGVWPYLKQLDPTASKEFLGWVVAANPLGQMLFSPVLGWYANKVGSTRSAFVVTIFFAIIGNIIYAILPLAKSSARFLILTSRFIVGVSGANVAICRSYIVSSTKLKERTAALSATAASQAIGFILGPSIQTGLVFLVDTNPASNVTNVSVQPTRESINVYAMAGYVAAAMCALNLVLFLPCLFQEFNLAEKEVRMTSRENSEMTFKQKSDMPAIVVILFQTFMLVLVFVLIETLLVPMCMDIYAWTSTYAVTIVGIALTAFGTVSTVMFGIGGYLSKKFDERKVYIFLGVVPMVLSMLLFFPVGNTFPKIKYCNATDILENRERRSIVDDECMDLGCPASQEWCFTTPVIFLPQLLIACLLCSIGYPVSLALSNGIFSKMLGFKPQGLWMGVLSSVMSFSRVVGPIFVTYMYTLYGMRWTFGILFFVMTFVLFTCWYFFDRIKPLEILKVHEELEGVLETLQQNGNSVNPKS